MNQYFKKVSVSLMALMMVTTASSGGSATKSTKTSGVNWNPVMDAIIQVESEGNPNAVSGKLSRRHADYSDSCEGLQCHSEEKEE